MNGIDGIQFNGIQWAEGAYIMCIHSYAVFVDIIYIYIYIVICLQYVVKYIYI